MNARLTIHEVARICRVAPRTVCKWFDMGRLKGWREMESNDRRICREHLLEFLRRHGMKDPAEALERE